MFTALALTACAIPQSELAPAGELRVALLMGNPALVRERGGELSGVAVDLGRDLAAELGVRFVPIRYDNVPAVLAAASSNQWDVAFIAQDPARTEVRFASAYMDIENTLLVRAGAPIASFADMDRPGRRIVVQNRDAADLYLTRTLKQAELVRATHATAPGMLAAGRADAYAANRLRLEGVAATLPGSRVLPGSFLALPQAIAVPLARVAALPYLDAFVREAIRDGRVQRAIDRAGVPGAVPARAPS